jgi:hypothetical protein
MRLPTLALVAALSTLSGIAADASPPEADEHEQTGEIMGIRRGWLVDIQNREAVRLFWRVRYRAAPPSGFWRGNLDACDPGETLSEERELTLARINWFRAMAGVPADTQEDPAATRKTQAAALVVAANGRIAHEIDPSWRCYSDDAREGAKVSLLGTGANGPEAATNFMRDDGPANAGAHHRRWLLYPQSRFIGLGDVPHGDKARAASGFTAFDGLYGSNRPPVLHDYVAWPPPGWVPYQVVFPRWSFALQGADFSDAHISVMADGRSLPVSIELSDKEAGEPAIIWRVGAEQDENAFKPSRDTVYRVAIDNVRLGDSVRHYSYDVKVFDPDAPPPMREATVIGPSHIGVQGGHFGIPPLAGATGSQWRALRVELFALQEGAENGYGAFSYSGSNTYSVLQQAVVASGKQAFRLAHTGVGSESLTLAQPILASPTSLLIFKSRRGVAGTDEVALVEALVEGHDAWEQLYAQRSDGTTAGGEKTFSERRVNLSQYAGRLVQLRFRYAFDAGSYFAPDDPRIGWYLDDIRLDGVFRVVETGRAAPSNQGQFDFTPDRPGEWRLQARPMVYRATGDWGPLAAVKME